MLALPRIVFKLLKSYCLHRLWFRLWFCSRNRFMHLRIIMCSMPNCYIKSQLRGLHSSSYNHMHSVCYWLFLWFSKLRIMYFIWFEMWIVLKHSLHFLPITIYIWWHFMCMWSLSRALSNAWFIRLRYLLISYFELRKLLKHFCYYNMLYLRIKDILWWS